MEGVDRNVISEMRERHRTKVALLMEGVDRNIFFTPSRSSIAQSPSSWRAWIEISRSRPLTRASPRSPSSWRAWIEIQVPHSGLPARQVALLMEGVDRNIVRKKKAKL